MKTSGATKACGHAEGFSLIELLVALAMVSLLMVGLTGSFLTHHQSYTRQALLAEREDNLRMAAGRIGDHLRIARSGAPRSFLASWFPWVSGFTTNPKVTEGGTTDSLSVAACFQRRIATLSNAANGGAVTVTLQSQVPDRTVGQLFDNASKRLLLIGEAENAHVVTITGNTVSIDTNPRATGAQGLRRVYPAGTPVCRVDVLTYDISNGSLVLNRHQGAGAEALADGIVALQVDLPSASRYRLGLTARLASRDPVSGQYLTTTTATDLILRN